MSLKSKLAVLATAAVLAGVTVPTFVWSTPVAVAQNQPGNGGGGGGGRQGGGGNWRQQMMDRLKDQLGTSDEEFAAIQPKIEKVQELMRQNMGGGYGGGRGGRGGGGGGGGNNTPDSALQTARTALQETLKNKDAKPEEIKSKLDTYRAAKVKAKEDLTKAQEDLKTVLSQRQEAVLVEFGMLE